MKRAASLLNSGKAKNLRSSNGKNQTGAPKTSRKAGKTIARNKDTTGKQLSKKESEEPEITRQRGNQESLKTKKRSSIYLPDSCVEPVSVKKPHIQKVPKKLSSTLKNPKIDPLKNNNYKTTVTLHSENSESTTHETRKRSSILLPDSYVEPVSVKEAHIQEVPKKLSSTIENPKIDPQKDTNYKITLTLYPENSESTTHETINTTKSTKLVDDEKSCILGTESEKFTNDKENNRILEPGRSRSELKSHVIAGKNSSSTVDDYNEPGAIREPGTLEEMYNTARTPEVMSEGRFALNPSSPSVSESSSIPGTVPRVVNSILEGDDEELVTDLIFINDATMKEYQEVSTVLKIAKLEDYLPVFLGKWKAQV
ncbi:hypothetical protein ACFFRR_001657 [Megaselia abdita]